MKHLCCSLIGGLFLLLVGTAGAAENPDAAYTPTHDYSVHLSNVDDYISVFANEKPLFTCNFLQTCNVDITPYLQTGRNTVTFEVYNRQQGYTYGIGLYEDGQAIFETACGTVNVIGCNENDNALGRVRSFNILVSE